MIEIFRSLSSIIQTVTGVKDVILANPNNPSPSGAYASILIAQSASPTSSGTLKSKVSDDQMNVEITNRYPVVWECTINFWRGDAIANASKLVRAQYLPIVSDTLLSKNMGWVNCSDVINLTALQSSNFEQRAQVTIKITTFEEVKQTVNTILSAKISFENEQSQLLQTVEVGKI